MLCLGILIVYIYKKIYDIIKTQNEINQSQYNINANIIDMIKINKNHTKPPLINTDELEDINPCTTCQNNKIKCQDCYNFDNYSPITNQ
jgi:hypothetical protein